MSKKDIYAESYTIEPVDNSAALGKLRVRESVTDRQKIGVLLREGRASVKRLTVNLQLLEKKHQLLSGKSRKIEALLNEERDTTRRLRREIEVLRIENRRLGVRV